MLATALTRSLAIDHPIIQAGMGSDAGVSLARAVCEAGGLGTLGSIGLSPRQLEAELARMQAATSRPWSVNVVTFDWAPFADAVLDAVIAARPPVVTLSFGDPVPALERCKEAGLTVIVQVQDFAAARAVLAAGADALIVQGHEAGGHTGRRGTLSLAAQVLDIAGEVPIAIAGGVGNGRGLAAALAMGAAGVVMGTRFKATPEFGSPGTTHADAQKASIVENNGDQTIIDEITDLALGMKWPGGIRGRVLANRFTAEWLGRGEELRAEVAAGEMFAWTAANNSAPDTVLNWAGESSGLVHEILPAAEVVRRTVDEAEALLAKASELVAVRSG